MSWLTYIVIGLCVVAFVVIGLSVWQVERRRKVQTSALRDRR